VLIRLSTKLPAQWITTISHKHVSPLIGLGSSCCVKGSFVVCFFSSDPGLLFFHADRRSSDKRIPCSAAGYIRNGFAENTARKALVTQLTS